MVFDVLAGAVLVLHLAFILFVAGGALLSWRWPRLVWAHVPTVVWAAGIVTIGYACPLTPLEKWLRRQAGGDGYDGGFVDRYVEDVIYPGEMTGLLRALALAAIVAGYAGLLRRRQAAGYRQPAAASSAASPAGAVSSAPRRSSAAPSS